MRRTTAKKHPRDPKGGPLTRLGELIGDGLLTLVKWNLLFLLCTLPVVTLGPALSAVLFCANALVIDDQPQFGAGKLFFSSFSVSLRRSFLLGLLELFVTAVFGGGFFLYVRMMNEGSILAVPLASVSLLVLFLFWAVMLHLHPLLFSMEETDWNTFRAAASKKPLRELISQAAFAALSRPKRTAFAVLFSVFFIGGQVLIFPTVLPLTVTVGLIFPALASAFAHTDPDF